MMTRDFPLELCPMPDGEKNLAIIFFFRKCVKMHKFVHQGKSWTKSKTQLARISL